MAAVRRGDDRAFEALYQRYQRRIHAYVLGMVKDHGRAEDVTQEVFVSALRRMRATERPIAFKPWIYEIAKNACIDAFRRSRRGEEVSFDAEGALGPADQSRLVGSDPSPEAAVAAKHDLETLCGAFGGLSESHHRILVLRELEGLSYEQIGAQMGLTRPAVESTLFRARRRLTEEYDELVSGARCARVQSIIAAAAAGAVGVRDTRRLSRHLSHCQVCRREAMAAGLDRGLLVRRPVRRLAGKLAALLPLPTFLFGRSRGAARPESWTSPPASPASGSSPGAWTSPPAAAASPPAAVSSPPGTGLAAHLPALSDQLSNPWSKAIAGVALLLAGVGTGVGVQQATRSHPAPPPAIHNSAHNSPVAPAATPGASVTAPGASSRGGGAKGEGAAGSARQRSHSAKRSGSAADRATSGGGGAPAAGSPTSGGGASSSSSGGSVPSSVTKQLPKVGLPATTSDPVKQVTDTTNAAAGAVDQTADTVNGAVDGATGTVAGAVEDATGTVTQTTQQVTGGGPVAGTVQSTANTVNQTVDGATQTVDGAATTTETVTGGLLGDH